MSVVTSDIVFVARASYKSEQGAPLGAARESRGAAGARASPEEPGHRPAATGAVPARNTRVKKVR